MSFSLQWIKVNAELSAWAEATKFQGCVGRCEPDPPEGEVHKEGVNCQDALHTKAIVFLATLKLCVRTRPVI